MSRKSYSIDDTYEFLSSAIDNMFKLNKNDIDNSNTMYLFFKELYNIYSKLYTPTDSFGYIKFNELESIDEYNSFDKLLEEYVYLNISKYYNISFLEYINMPIREKHKMAELASRLIKEENMENERQKKQIEDSMLEHNLQSAKAKNG